MLKQKTIEIELANAKLRESQLHREKDSKEKETSHVIMETTIKQLHQQLEISLKSEHGLREQLKVHNEKYEEFQDAVSKSNKVGFDWKLLHICLPRETVRSTSSLRRGSQQIGWIIINKPNKQWFISQQMFSDFKGEIDTMSKQTKRFEKEAMQWKQRWSESNMATARVLQEKTKSDLRVETLTRLCRSLQEKLKLTGSVVAGSEFPTVVHVSIG